MRPNNRRPLEPSCDCGWVQRNTQASNHPSWCRPRPSSTRQLANNGRPVEPEKSHTRDVAGRWLCDSPVHVRHFARAESVIMGRRARPIAARVPRSFLDDIRYLLRHLDIASADEATSVLMRYFDESQILPKTRLILEKILGR
jgi:hypothetical protein